MSDKPKDQPPDREEPKIELTPVGEQFVIPGCEKKPPRNGKTHQRGLWD